MLVQLDLLLQQLLVLANVLLWLLLTLLFTAQLDDVVDFLLELADLLLHLLLEEVLDLALSLLYVHDVTFAGFQLSDHVQLLQAALSLLDLDLLAQYLVNLVDSRLPVSLDVGVLLTLLLLFAGPLQLGW